MKRYAILVAGGKSIRMGGELPKQFMLLNGTPVLMRTIEKFHDYDKFIKIIVVLPSMHVEYWNKLCADYKFSIHHHVVIGGEERFFSVRNGLESIDDVNSIVAIHDGVRPLVSKETISRCFDSAQATGSAIPSIQSTDSVRLLTINGSKALDRSTVRLVQTPQTFKTALIRNAMYQQWNPSFTDEATVLENTGVEVTMVEGNIENVKLTSPIDFLVAEKYIELQGSRLIKK